MPIVLRPYQQDILNQLTAALARESLLLVLPTGGGKTVIFCELARQYAARQQRVCILVHRAELIEQVSATLTTMGVDHGCISPHYQHEPSHRVQVASVATLVRRLAHHVAPDLLIIDECFSAGTLIDGTPIEHLKVGDVIRSVHHGLGQVAKQKIVRVFKRRPSAIMSITIQGTRIVCTPDHPIYVRGKGYVLAKTISINDYLAHMPDVREISGHAVPAPLRGDRRGQPPCASEKSAGCKENRMAQWVRVDGIEIHKPTSDGTFGGVCRDGFVYNLEVEHNHNYFANDILVHNCHHAIPRTSWGRVIAAWPHSHRLGVTATPCRLSGEGLGDLFSRLIVGPSVEQLISIDALSDYQLFAPPVTYTDGLHRKMGDYDQRELAAATDKPSITGNAITHYSKHAHGKRALVFCVSVQHARHVADSFVSAGYAAAALDGTMVPPERARIISDFVDGRTRVLTSCDLISEGFDLPAIEAAILLRPTQSVTIYMQQIGRALRPYPGKAHAIILDHAGNARRHGLPDEDREWTLHIGKKKNNSEQDRVVALRTCGACFLAVQSTSSQCRYCGYIFPITPRIIQEIAGELVLVEAMEQRRDARREQGRASTLEQLQAIEKLRKYKNGWAWHVYNARKARGGW
jgi:DNA repair protein RadD